jgi:CheY-like chemotaxis protein
MGVFKYFVKKLWVQRHQRLSEQTVQVSSPTRTILLASQNVELAKQRAAALEQEGYQAVIATTIHHIAMACLQNIDVVVIGSSIPTSEKRRVLVEIRRHCQAPVLELFEMQPCLQNEHGVQPFHSLTHNDFIRAIEGMLRAQLSP